MNLLEFFEYSDRQLAIDVLPHTPMSNLSKLVRDVEQWGVDKQIIGPDAKGTIGGQLAKFLEEVNETEFAVMEILEDLGHNPDITDAQQSAGLPAAIDGIGDTIVTLILLAHMLGTDIERCLQAAYDVISKRTGHMKGGIFVKDS